MGYMWLWWIPILFLVIGVGWWFARGTSARSASRPESPEQMLKHRYAAGAIDRQEYESKLEDLRR